MKYNRKKKKKQVVAAVDNNVQNFTKHTVI